MDVVGRVKDITESISAEMKSRREKVAADAKDAIRRLSSCVKDLVDRAERGTLTKVDEDLDGLAADVTRKMGRIALANEEAQRMKRMLGGFQEEVLSIRSAKAETSLPEEPSPDPRLLEENKYLKKENTQLEKDLASMQKDLDDALSVPHMPAGDKPAKKTTPDSGSGGAVTTPVGKEGDKTPEQEAEEQAGEGKKGDAKK